jgi:hypothetical protein
MRGAWNERWEKTAGRSRFKALKPIDEKNPKKAARN